MLIVTYILCMRTKEKQLNSPIETVPLRPRWKPHRTRFYGAHILILIVQFQQITSGMHGLTLCKNPIFFNESTRFVRSVLEWPRWRFVSRANHPICAIVPCTFINSDTVPTGNVDTTKFVSVILSWKRGNCFSYPFDFEVVMMRATKSNHRYIFCHIILQCNRRGGGG